MVPSSCVCRFNLPRFRNLAQTCRDFVFPRRFSVPLFPSARNRCGILFFVGLSVAFCTTYEIGAYLGVVYVSKPAVVCPSWLFFCFLHYVSHRCLLRRRICFLTVMAYTCLSFFPTLCTTYVIRCLLRSRICFVTNVVYLVCALALPLFSTLRTP